jgi:hypothetical protein
MYTNFPRAAVLVLFDRAVSAVFCAAFFAFFAVFAIALPNVLAPPKPTA